MSRILVTGATGFVGSHLYKLLHADGHTVFGTTKSRVSDNIHYCNIENIEEVSTLIHSLQPDVIIHSAAISSVTSSSSYEYYLSNTVGTENILDAVSKLDRKTRFIFISTAGVYGNQDTECLSEELCPKPVHHYGMSKFCGERVLHNYKEFVDYTILRPFNIIGVGQSSGFIVPKLAKAFAARNHVIRLGNIAVYRDYLDITEACEIIRYVITSKEAIGQTYNLCSGMPVSLEELLDLFRSFTGHDIEIEIAPEFVRKNEVWRLIGDAKKIRHLVGDTVKSIPVEHSIQKIIAAEESALR